MQVNLVENEAAWNTSVRTLVLSSLYPNPVQPRHGIFIENRILDQVRSGRVEVRVIAPVAWFPFRHRLFGGYSRLAGVPKEDQRHGIRVSHPRYPLVPKVGMTIAPALLAASLIRPIQIRTNKKGYPAGQTGREQLHRII